MATTVKLSWPKAAVLYIMPSHVPSVHSRAFTSIPLFQILIWFVQVWRGVKPWTIRTPGTQRGVAQSGLNISLIYWLPRECEAKRDALPNHIHQPEGSSPCFASNSNISLPGTSPVLRNHNPVEGKNCWRNRSCWLCKLKPRTLGDRQVVVIAMDVVQIC